MTIQIISVRQKPRLLDSFSYCLRGLNITATLSLYSNGTFTRNSEQSTIQESVLTLMLYLLMI